MWFNQLQEAIIAVVEPQTWGGIPPILQVTGINRLIDFIYLRIAGRNISLPALVVRL